MDPFKLHHNKVNATVELWKLNLMLEHTRLEFSPSQEVEAVATTNKSGR